MFSLLDSMGKNVYLPQNSLRGNFRKTWITIVILFNRHRILHIYLPVIMLEFCMLSFPLATGLDFNLNVCLLLIVTISFCVHFINQII